MKKVLLSAFLCVALSVTAFAEVAKDETQKNQKTDNKSSEIKNEEYFYPCTFTITTWNTFDQVVRAETITANTPDATGEDGCCDFADYKVTLKNRELAHTPGYYATHDR